MPLAATLPGALTHARQQLLAMRGGQLHWTGDPAGSAAATATALCAFGLVQRQFPGADPRLAPRMEHGLSWLADNSNPDGGWGETNLSPSDLPTTALVWAALGAVPDAASRYASVARQAEQVLSDRVAEALAHSRQLSLKAV